MSATAALTMLNEVGGQVKIEFVKVNGTVRQYLGACIKGAVRNGCLKFSLNLEDPAAWRGSRLDTIVRLAVYVKGEWKLCNMRSMDDAKRNAAAALANRGDAKAVSARPIF